MKALKNIPCSKTVPAVSLGDSPKLISILTLATAAAASPQSGNAMVIYTDLSVNPIHIGFSDGCSSSYEFNLPGTAQFGFAKRSHTSVAITYRTVTAGRQGGGLLVGAQATSWGYVAPQPHGAAWNPALQLFNNVVVGAAATTAYFPGSGYDHRYLGFLFQDTTQSGSPLRYGWVEIGLSIGTVGVYPYGPAVTIYGYAFDNTGTLITMGAVPEPAPMGVLALGALTFGARGVRAWRRNQPTTGES